MPTGDAYSFGHLVPSLWGLAYVLLVETNPFPNLSLFFRTMLFEYPSVLSRFCLVLENGYYDSFCFTVFVWSILNLRNECPIGTNKSGELQSICKLLCSKKGLIPSIHKMISIITIFADFGKQKTFWQKLLGDMIQLDIIILYFMAIC